jgi:signal transduction histidine kinase
MGPLFEKINRTTDSLLSLNQERADREIARIASLQQRAVIVLAVLTIVWTAFALITATSVIRVIDEHSRLLEERNRELDAFAGRVAHDLRGPLSTINLAAAAIELQKPGEPDARAALRRGVGKMEAIIQDLLALSRVSSQPTGEVAQTPNVAAYVREDLEPKVDAIGGLLRIEVADAAVFCGEGLLRQALWNLADNAVKYRRPEVQLQIEIRGGVTPRGYEFTVSDNGMGMSPHEVRQVFQPFFRAKKAEAKPGTGLGLSIVKRVIEASGGSVFVDSAAGEGTTFTIRLPLATSKAA